VRGNGRRPGASRATIRALVICHGWSAVGCQQL